jgi:hypothetical protein
MTKTILLATTVVVALAGCESIYRITGMSSPPPDPKNPQVWVMTKTGCEKPYIVVSPEPIYIYRGNGAATITWHLQTTGYSFATPAQTPQPVPGSGSPLNEITCPSASGNNMVCINKAQNSGAWKYAVRITADPTGHCNGSNPPDLDPIISND